MLNEAFAEGRLANEGLATRAGRAYGARRRLL